MRTCSQRPLPCTIAGLEDVTIPNMVKSKHGGSCDAATCNGDDRAGGASCGGMQRRQLNHLGLTDNAAHQARGGEFFRSQRMVRPINPLMTTGYTALIVSLEVSQTKRDRVRMRRKSSWIFKKESKEYRSGFDNQSRNNHVFAEALEPAPQAHLSSREHGLHVSSTYGGEPKLYDDFHSSSPGEHGFACSIRRIDETLEQEHYRIGAAQRRDGAFVSRHLSSRTQKA